MNLACSTFIVLLEFFYFTLDKIYVVVVSVMFSLFIIKDFIVSIYCLPVLVLLVLWLCIYFVLGGFFFFSFWCLSNLANIFEFSWKTLKYKVIII